MAEKKRQCGTCRFFVEKGTGGHGKCTHPERAGSDAELLLLRPNELGCRTKWGTSLWQDPADESDPTEKKSPQQPTLPEPIAAQLQYDDEVTSVSIAGSKSSRPSYDDDVVDSGATASGMASWNDPVQDERLDLLRRGSQDALAGARKRHLEKQARQRELIPFADDDEAPEPHASTPEPADEPDQKQVASSKKQFPPDDFVEEERSTADDEAPIDDEMVDEGVTIDKNRSPRLRKLLREPKNPKSEEAMRPGMPAEMRVTSNNPERREQWNSVPTLNPGFELPLSKPADPAPSAPVKVAASAAPVADSTHNSRPVSQARELLYEDRLRQERKQRQVIAPLAEDTPQEPKPKPSQPQRRAENRPRLKEAPPATAAPVERIKSSPLRGYHPATQKQTEVETTRSEHQDEQPRRRLESAPPRAERLQLKAPVAPPRGQQAGHKSRSSESRPEGQRQPDAAPKRQARPRLSFEPAPKQQPRASTQHKVNASPERQPQARSQSKVDAAPERQPQAQTQRVLDPGPVREEQERPQRRTPDVYHEQALPRQRKPYIPMQAVSANTPFEREEIEIAPDVPRMCGTCTSYRPSGVPGRGSCTNAFAGPVQRVVYEQDLSCQHTFGAFWLPADEEVWLEELPDHSAPTPRVNAMLARKRRKKNTVLPDIEELTS